MTNQYTQVRRRWRDVEPERDLKALWATERFETPERVHDALRVMELAIQVVGWDTVKGWAREQLAAGAILNAQLVELAMRALERADDAFLAELGASLRERSPANYFRFWLTLFTAKHSHRGERIFRGELAQIEDFQLVKYRRWIRRIFRKLRFRCDTPREKSIAAIAFSMHSHFKGGAYTSEAFDAFVTASKTASTWKKDDKEKPVTREKQAAIFATAAARLGIWSVVEGIRTSNRIPRTLGYLAAMAPRMTDVEVLRALRAFDAHLGAADHKKAPEQVVQVAEYLHGRLAKIDVPLEEWGKILPYASSPTLVRVLEGLLGVRLEATIAQVGTTACVPQSIVDLALDARGARVAFLLGYVLARTHADTSATWIDTQRAVRVITPATRYWPYGVGIVPGASRWQEQPDHPHRVLFGAITQAFPTVAKQAKPTPSAVDPVLHALRWQLWRRQLLDGSTSAADLPIIFLAGAPPEDQRAALAIMLDAFAAAILCRFEERWDEPIDLPHVLCLTLPRAVGAALAELQRAIPTLADARATFAERKPRIDRETRMLLLAPPPLVLHAETPKR